MMKWSERVQDCPKDQSVQNTGNVLQVFHKGRSDPLIWMNFRKNSKQHLTPLPLFRETLLQIFPEIHVVLNLYLEWSCLFDFDFDSIYI